jgi:hypothetical protein
MSFFNQLKENLNSQEIYNGLKGKYENRFKVDGQEYAFIATTIAGSENDDQTQWMLEFENTSSHRINTLDNNPKMIKAFAEAVSNWVKERNPYYFYTYGSHIDSLKSIIEGVKKKVKGYNLIDDTQDKKNEDTGDVVIGNPIGKIVWTKMVEQTISTEDLANTKLDKFEKTYEEPKDVKPNKTFLSGIKDEKLDKGDKSYAIKTESVMDVPTKHQMKIALDTIKMSKMGAQMMGGMNHEEAIEFLLSHGYTSNQVKNMLLKAGHDANEFFKTESINQVAFFVQKFKDKMKGSNTEDAMKWVDGIGEISKKEKDEIKKKIEPYIEKSKTESWNEFKSKKLCEFEDMEDDTENFDDEDLEMPTEPDEEDCVLTPSGRLGSKISVSCGGKFIGEFNDESEALRAVKQWQVKNEWFPNIWWVSDHGNAWLIDINGNVMKESVLFESLKVKDFFKSVKNVYKKFKEKFTKEHESAMEIASDPAKLKDWLEKNRPDFVSAMDIVKHMVDKKQLTFEQTILQGIHLEESLLDIFAKKTPNALIAAAIILTVMGSGNKVFAANDTGEEAFAKAKQQWEKVVEIVKEEGKKIGKDFSKKKIEKKVEKTGKQVQKKIKQGTDIVKDKMQDTKDKFQDFMLKKKSNEEKPKNDAPIVPPSSIKMNTIDV